jgi:glycosyltransferase involved in cell wall biosynthesis
VQQLTNDSNLIELSIILPCLNEEETLQTVLDKCFMSLDSLGVVGEVIVADNGSTDESLNIVSCSAAKLVQVSTRGYGAALLGGIAEARGEFVIMGDADDSYALDDLGVFFKSLKAGNDLVMGNRFQGGIAKGAMPWLHKFIGNPILSWFGRLFFKIPIGDFHCGLRGFKTDSIRNLGLTSHGMEFASEMIVKTSLAGLKIAEVPTTLKPDGRSRAPHLRTWRDGWRHMIFLLAASPRWLFLYPGLALSGLGFFGMLVTSGGEINLGKFQLYLNTYFIALGLTLAGIQITLMAILVRIFSTDYGILPKSKNVSLFQKYFTLERGIIVGLNLIATAVIGFILLLLNWTGSGFEDLSASTSLQLTGLLVLSLVSGVQILFASFFAVIIQV